MNKKLLHTVIKRFLLNDSFKLTYSVITSRLTREYEILQDINKAHKAFQFSVTY